MGTLSEMFEELLERKREDEEHYGGHWLGGFRYNPRTGRGSFPNPPGAGYEEETRGMGDFDPNTMFRGQAALGPFWDWMRATVGQEPNPAIFQTVAGQSYTSNPLLGEVSAMLEGGELEDTLMDQAQTRASVEMSEGRRKRQERLTRSGMQDSGLNEAVEGLQRFQSLGAIEDSMREAKLASISAMQNFGLAQARDIADLWSRVANVRATEEGMRPTGGGSGWSEVGQGVGTAAAAFASFL